MTASVLGGPLSWSASRDKEGHRTYNIAHQVKTTDQNDGPAKVLNCLGLPQVGDSWNFGTDFDEWAFCYPEAQIKPYQQKGSDPHRFWKVEQVFSTRPLERCQDDNIEDPLLIPDRISGSFSKYTEESSKDRNGETIKSSSHEIFTGPLVEWDASRPSVVIEQNRADLELSTLAEFIDKVNDAKLWGLDARKVKLSNISWDRKWYGTCSVYYTRRLEFDINFETFDRYIPDQGSKVLKGAWNKVPTPPVWVPDASADKNDPTHFIRFTDAKDNVTRTLLDGAGNPLTQGTGTGPPEPEKITFEKYEEDNFLTLGIPIVLT